MQIQDDSSDEPGSLVILSGPSCIGKSPLVKALGRFHPELVATMQPLVLYNSRAPRPGEIDGRDYHFRTRDQVGALRAADRMLVLEVRNDLQALDLEDLDSMLEKGDVLYEGNPYIAHALQTHPMLEKVSKTSIFLSPLSRQEILFLKSPGSNISLPDLVTDIMRRKLLRRSSRQKSVLSLKDLEDIETRASRAYAEMKFASSFAHVIPNHDGEDSENWDAFYHPLGSARRAVLAVAAILEGKTHGGVERWESDLLP